MSTGNHQEIASEVISERESIEETHALDGRAFVATDKRFIAIWKGQEGVRSADRVQAIPYKTIGSIEIDALGQGPIDWNRIVGGNLLFLVTFLFGGGAIVAQGAAAVFSGVIGLLTALAGMYLIYEGIQRDPPQVMMTIHAAGAKKIFGLGDSGLPFATSVVQNQAD